MKCYETYELKFKGAEPVGSHVEIDLEAVFTIGKKSWKVKGFYAGNGEYVIRFLPSIAGMVSYQVTGLFTAEGQEECTASTASHGMVQAVDTHFEYQDGTCFYPFGTTVYALAHQSEELIAQTFDTLSKAPFNKMRHCIFPKDYDYNHNEPDFYPFEKKADGSWDVNHPCFAYWNHMEKVIDDLGAMGIESDLILFHPYDRWGFATLSQEDNITYLNYLLRRLSAKPYIWWSLANEFDLCFVKNMDNWYEIEAYVHDHDPYGHLLSNHNCVLYYDFSRPYITHVCAQTAAMYRATEWMEKLNKPVMFDECCYEGDIQFTWGNISAFELVNRFWKGCVQGAYATHGETYLADDEILWWSRGGVLKGESAPRIAYLRKFIESLPMPLTPFKEDKSAEHEKAKDMPEDAPFRKVFTDLDPGVAADMAWKDAEFTGKCGEDIYVKYLGNQTCRLAIMRLPVDSDNHYKIEKIDVWNMTRETVLDDVKSGYIRVPLDGKEGIALVATKIIK